MSEAIPLGEPWNSRGWRLKIRDREIREPPHATLFGPKGTWRWDLRRRRFMDKHAGPRLVPEDLAKLLVARHEELVAAWDRLYPANPVFGND